MNNEEKIRQMCKRTTCEDLPTIGWMLRTEHEREKLKRLKMEVSGKFRFTRYPTGRARSLV